MKIRRFYTKNFKAKMVIKREGEADLEG